MNPEFVLIDFENVQPQNLGLFNGRAVQIRVFLGRQQARIPVAMAQALQAFGPNAEYIQIEGNGNNALDFHIAYYIGRLAAEHPGASFHIVSRDTGFDPLIRHLRASGISCRRTKSLQETGPGKVLTTESKPEKVAAVIDRLARQKGSKPRTLKTLRGTIKSYFANQLCDEELDDLIGELTRSGTVKVDDGNVHYELPT